LLSWLTGLMHPRGAGGRAPWRYVYAVLVYLACVPGIFASVLTGYALFFRDENLLEVNALVYVLPIVTMAATLVLVRRSAELDEVPGFERLSGLIVMLAASFAIALGLRKTRIFLFFGSSIITLFVLAAGSFVLLRWGAQVAFGRDARSE